MDNSETLVMEASEKAVKELLDMLENVGDRRATDEELKRYAELYQESNGLSALWMKRIQDNPEKIVILNRIGKAALSGREDNIHYVLDLVLKSMKDEFPSIDVDFHKVMAKKCMTFWKAHDHVGRLLAIGIG